MEDHSYSPDVEIDENGNLVYARDIALGDMIQIPVHMMGRLARYEPDGVSADGKRATVTIHFPKRWRP
jgi:hypothetical protein